MVEGKLERFASAGGAINVARRPHRRPRRARPRRGRGQGLLAARPARAGAPGRGGLARGRRGRRRGGRLPRRRPARHELRAGPRAMTAAATRGARADGARHAVRPARRVGVQRPPRSPSRPVGSARMTWLVVVLAFVLLGVAVVAAAFGGRRSPSSRPSKAGRRAFAIGAVALIVVTGIALPVLGLLSGHDDAADAAGGVTLTASEVKGRQIFAEQLLELPPARRGQRRRQGRAEPRRPAPEGGAHRGRRPQRSCPRRRPDAPGPALRAGAQGRRGLRRDVRRALSGRRRGPSRRMPAALAATGAGALAATSHRPSSAGPAGPIRRRAAATIRPRQDR